MASIPEPANTGPACGIWALANVAGSPRIAIVSMLWKDTAKDVFGGLITVRNGRHISSAYGTGRCWPTVTPGCHEVIALTYRPSSHPYGDGQR